MKQILILGWTKTSKEGQNAQTPATCQNPCAPWSLECTLFLLKLKSSALMGNVTALKTSSSEQLQSADFKWALQSTVISLGR